MSDVVELTPSAAAASPAHPDHARWVKDQMIAREVSWLRSLGVEVQGRKVEAHIHEGMRRMYARKREQVKPVLVKPDTATRRRNAERLAGELGARLIRRPIAQHKLRTPRVPYTCNLCGTCVRCRRERRYWRILELARAGDTRLVPLAQDLMRAALRSAAQLPPFEGLSEHDQNRLVTRLIEDVCDRSTAVMGPWR